MASPDSLGAKRIRIVVAAIGATATVVTFVPPLVRPNGEWDLPGLAFTAALTLVFLLPFVIYVRGALSTLAASVIGVLILASTAWWTIGSWGGLRHIDDGLEMVWPMAGVSLSLLIAGVGGALVRGELRWHEPPPSPPPRPDI
jgi:hypothetical protein